MGDLSGRAGQRRARVGPPVQLPLQGGPAAARHRLPAGRGGGSARDPAHGREARSASPRCASTCPGSTRRSTQTRRDAADPYAHPVSALRRILVETARLRPRSRRRICAATSRTSRSSTSRAPTASATSSRPSRRRASPRIAAAGLRALPGRPGALLPLRRRAARRLPRARRAASGAVLMLASDHGFSWGEGRPTRLSSFAHATAAKWHRKDGIYLLRGPGIAASDSTATPTKAASAQVCATLLALLGFRPGKRLAWPPLPPRARAGRRASRTITPTTAGRRRGPAAARTAPTPRRSRSCARSATSAPARRHRRPRRPGDRAHAHRRLLQQRGACCCRSDGKRDRAQSPPSRRRSRSTRTSPPLRGT